MLPYINVFGIQLPMYGICMAAAICLAVTLSCLRAKKRGQSWDDLISIAAVAVICGLLGAKLLYIIVTYSPKEIAEGIRANGFFSFFANTGLVFYGALIGGIGGALLGAKLFKKKLVCYCDAIVPTLPLAHSIGRLGCFCAGCCYGKETESWIGMRFPNSVAGLSPDVRVIPVQLIESCANLFVFAFLLWYTRKRRRGYTSLFVYMMIYAAERFLIEKLRGDEIRGIFMGLSTSQWISIGLLVIGLAGLILTRVYYSKRPQAIGAAGAGMKVSGSVSADVCAERAADGEADGESCAGVESEPDDSSGSGKQAGLDK